MSNRYINKLFNTSRPLRSNRINNILSTVDGKKQFRDAILSSPDRNNIPPIKIGNKTFRIKIVGSKNISLKEIKIDKPFSE